ncbi:hypothetical protein [Moraxella oblonga]|uniref:hypothetical protein n=1 Tax=Moraxella oblonga TaxID=200413 RepID=UPI00082E6054|nr:hypothetical protein [Moraxella oblonga]
MKWVKAGIWAVLLLMGLYLWIFDWGVGYVLLSIASHGVLRWLLHKRLIRPHIIWVVLAVLFGVHVWAYQGLQHHQARHDTGERWSQYGAL